MKRIAILGPESTGKSTLSEGLAMALGGTLVPEYAREYLEKLGSAYQEADLLAMAKGQIAEEDSAEQSPWLICDTELTVIKIWSENSYGRIHPWIQHTWRARQYDAWLLCDIDIPWQDDPLREHPHLRQYLFDWYRAELNLLGVPYHIIRGSEADRLGQAIAICRALL